MEIHPLEKNSAYADYLRDESRRTGQADWIAFPQSTAEVREALETAAKNRWPVTVQGSRTGITGGCVPEGGLVLNLSRMNAIGKIEGDRIVVQPGALLKDIRSTLKGSGQFFPPDPTETTASIGGMVANNASGARSFRYGAVRNWIQSLEIVLANGETGRVERGASRADGLDFRLGSIAGRLPRIGMPDVKNAAGYFAKPDMDPIDLFIGSEGTLGIVTEIELRLLPEPGQVNGLTAFFASEAEALEFVRFLRSLPDGREAPAAIEFFDSHSLELLRRMKARGSAFADLPGLEPRFHTAIYFEYEGNVPESVVEAAGKALECWFSDEASEIERLKKFRHAVPEAVNLLIGERAKTIPGLAKLGTDLSVPDGQLEAAMSMYREGLARTGLDHVVFGHIGNNHLHVNILPRSLSEYETGKALHREWAKRVVGMGGSVSAEHGIGKNKTDLLEIMYGEDGVREMRKLKRLFDPDGRLNPGNLFPPERAS